MRPRPAPLMFMAVAVATLGLASAASPVSAGTAKVLRVGTFKPDPGSKRTATGPGAGSAPASSGRTQEFNPLAKGGRVLHVMSHYGHQSSKDDGQALQNLLVNFLLEATKHHPR